MKSKDLDGVRKKSLKELEEMVIKLEGDKIKEISNKMSAKSKNLKVARNLRKEIAQIKTLIREKQIIETLTKK